MREILMLEIVRGQSTAPTKASELANELAKLHDVEGTFFIGYPVLATADESKAVDGLLIAKKIGLIAFILDDKPTEPVSLEDWEKLQDEQDSLYFALKNHLGRHRGLRKGKKLAFNLRAITVLPNMKEPPENIDMEVSSIQRLSKKLSDQPTSLDNNIWNVLNAALQRVSTIRPRKKRVGVSKKDSYGAILKKLEAKIANLDRWQKPAAIESPEGPQRIRGLAGSGKTVVLALKAAYLHSQHPDWNIAITFYSRALGQQFRDLVRRFCFEHNNDEPDWERLHILHAWGGRGRLGFYNTIAERSGSIARDYAYAKVTYGMSNAFAGICRELFTFVSENPQEPIYDAILIDEAQDLPLYFFRLVYAFCKPPHRIVWAYDELQNLSNTDMPKTSDMFGTDETGQPFITVDNRPNEPKQDIILPCCYRNTPWALSLAHALGFGIYRDGNLVQHFDDPAVWGEIGYQVISGNLELGKHVTLERKPESYPDYFTELLKQEEVVQDFIFDDQHAQAEWVAHSIRNNISNDELDCDDILIILPNPQTAKKQASILRQALNRHKIKSHLVGETTSADDVFIPDSIALLHIHRAKGNEAPMVYIIDAQECVSGPGLIKLRNTLFTAITRSQAWVRICGFGLGMQSLKQEIDNVRKQNFKLYFKIPSLADLKQMRTVHRDLSPSERRKVEKARKGIQEFIEAFNEGTLQTETLDPDIRKQLEKILSPPEENNADSGLDEKHD